MNSVSSDISVWRLIVSGGPLMWPIVFCSIAAITVAIQKFLYFSNVIIDGDGLRDRIFERISSGDVRGAMELCDRERSPLGNVLKSGILKFSVSKHAMVESMEETSKFETAAVEDKLWILSAVGQIAPLLGFLGTVCGIAGTFYNIHLRSSSMNALTQVDVAGGIWQALVTTVAGLVVAISAVTFYHYFIHRRDRYIELMEKTALELANFSDQLRHSSEKGRM